MQIADWHDCEVIALFTPKQFAPTPFFSALLVFQVVKRRAKKAAKDDVLQAQAAEKAARALVAAKARELRETRRRVQEMESRRWICMRNGCNLRRFYSADRYNVHMSFHRADDELQRMRDREMARIKVCTGRVVSGE